MHSWFGNLKGGDGSLLILSQLAEKRERGAEKARLGLCTAPERNSIFYLLVLSEERLMILAKLKNDFVLSSGRQRN